MSPQTAVQQGNGRRHIVSAALLCPVESSWDTSLVQLAIGTLLMSQYLAFLWCQLGILKEHFVRQMMGPYFPGHSPWSQYWDFLTRMLHIGYSNRLPILEHLWTRSHPLKSHQISVEIPEMLVIELPLHQIGSSFRFHIHVWRSHHLYHHFGRCMQSIIFDVP